MLKIYNKLFKKIDNDYVYIVISILLAYIVTYFMVEQITNTLYVREPITGKINQAIRDIGNVGRDIGRIPDKIATESRKATGEINSGFSKVGGQVNNIGNKVDAGVNKAISETSKMTKHIDDKFSWFLKEVEKQTKDIVFNKIVEFFKLFGKAIKKGIVDPIFGLFIGLGNVFMIIFSIFEMIGKKIISLPGCVFWYIFYSIGSIIYAIINFFLGKTIMGWFNYIWKFCVWPFNEANNRILKPWLGLDLWYLYNSINNKCYKFPIDEKAKQMKNEFETMGSNFSRGFGKIEFRFSK
jgi:hypothetical protein